MINKPNKISSDAPMVVNPSILLNKPKPINVRLVANITAKYPISISFVSALGVKLAANQQSSLQPKLRRSPLILLLLPKLALLQAEEPSL